MENESPRDPWIKRIRWSQTGHLVEDERINAVASLWVEGTLYSIELPDEMREAIQATLPQSDPPASNLSDYVKSTRIAAEWLALAGALDFATQQGWRTPELRHRALEMMADSLARTASAIPNNPKRPVRRWWQNARTTPSGAAWGDSRIASATEKWIGGTIDRQQYIQELVDVQHEAQRRKPDLPPGSPDDQFPIWLQYVRLGAKSMILRTAADFADAQGWESAEGRRKAIELLDRALDAPVVPPPPGFSR